MIRDEDFRFLFLALRLRLRLRRLRLRRDQSVSRRLRGWLFSPISSRRPGYWFWWLFKK